MQAFKKHIFLFSTLFLTAICLQAQTSSLSLAIVSQGTNIKVDSAEVEILKSDIKAYSDEEGSVLFHNMPGGVFLIAVRHPRYESQTVTVSIPSGSNISQTVTLIPRLDEVVVTENREDQILEDHGFNHRMKTGFGTYITREEIKKKGRLNMTDVIRGIPGVNIRRYESRLIAAVNRSSSKNSNTPCALDVYVDGYNMGGSPPDLNMISTPAEVAAVEVYKGPSTLPARFNRFNSCGAIVIWTKQTIKDEKEEVDSR